MATVKTFSAVRSRIHTMLSAVTGIGVVHNHEPVSDSYDDYLANFRYEDEDGDFVVRGATQKRFNSIPTPDGGPGVLLSHTYKRRYIVIIRMYQTSIESKVTATAFDDRIETVLSLFDSDATLKTVVDVADPMIEQVNELRYFGRVLCHYAELHFPFDLLRARNA